MPLDKSAAIFIVGPTAIGKTALALDLARKINGEIISCDSMQVYKGMDILSQSPKKTETKKVRYHLVRFLSPTKEYSAGSFKRIAAHLIDDIIRRGKTPIIAGGTGLYVKALVDGLFPTPKADPKFRKEMYDHAARYGNMRLYKKLEKIDPDSASTIHPNNVRRVVRALEICHSTGRTMTELKRGTKGIADKYRIKIFGLNAPREEVYANVNARVEKMFASGVVREVKKLSGKRLSRTARAALGLKEILGYLKEEYSLDEAKELMKRNTRRYAKRQLTWFRADKRIKWIKDGEKIRWNELLR
ncbi:MAG: tRNA (adenosine(37)-N6)-dimethylallyltransferase MiaA [Candidatus Omnitrophica bacterium]|nr:tRNA (adenosine(37)-N6)-dimethylallyltransferase MiaA [Candidatus Omnitrophota bacterium]